MLRILAIIILLSGCSSVPEYHCTKEQQKAVKAETSVCVGAWTDNSGMPAELQADIHYHKAFICNSRARANHCTEITNEGN